MSSSKEGATSDITWQDPPVIQRLLSSTMFVQVFETHQVFETVDYLTFHLPWGLEIFTESVFMYYICCIQIIERDLNICVLGT